MTTHHNGDNDRDDSADEKIGAWVLARRFDCVNPVELPALLGEFDPSLASRSLDHLRECSQCRGVLALSIVDVVLGKQAVLGDLAGLHRFAHHAEPGIRASAARAVVGLSGLNVAAVDEAMRLSEDTDDVVRLEAIRALGSTDVDRLIATLVEATISVRALAASEVQRLGRATMTAAGELLTRALMPRFTELSVDAGIAEAMADSGPQGFKVSRTNDVELTVNESAARTLTIQVSVKIRRSSASASSSSVGSWSLTLPFRAIVRQPGESPSIEEFVEARVTLSEGERRQIPMNVKLAGRIVPFTGAP